MKTFVMYLLLSLFAVEISQTNQDRNFSKNFTKLQTCVFPQSRIPSALCNHWPNEKSLNKDVVSLTVTMSNIERVTLSMIDNLGLNLFGLQCLQMTKCNISGIEPDAFSTLIRLNEINISGNRLTHLPSALFANTKNIKKIDLSNNNLENLNESLFQDLLNLNDLDLSGNRLLNFPANLPRVLKYLNLENNLIRVIHNNVKLTNLLNLNLCQNRIIDFKFNEIGCSKLHTLCLDDSVVQPIGLHADAGLRQLNDLQELTIKGQKSTNEKLTIDHIGRIGGCTKLRKLRIERCDLVSLAILAQFSELDTLELQEVYVEASISPSFFNGCSNLRNLDLTGSPKLAQSILGNQDIRIKLQKLYTLTAKNCDIVNLNWIPDRIDVTSPSRPLPFPSLSIVDISGNNSFNCHDPHVKQALCRFDNLKRTENTQVKIVNRNLFILENGNSTNCRQQMSANSILQLNFNDCQEETNFSSGRPDTLTPSTPAYETVTEEIYKPRFDDENDADNQILYIVLGVFVVLLFLALIALALFYFHRRKSQIVKVPDCNKSTTKQSFDNPQLIQSEV